MKTALENLIVVLKDENTISPYEMCSSGLVQALFTVLNNVSVPFTAVIKHPVHHVLTCKHGPALCRDVRVTETLFCLSLCAECGTGPET